MKSFAPATLAATIVTATLAFAAPALACPTHDVALPRAAGKGQPREVKEVLDTPFVKLVTITLRGGTVLAKHSAAEAITIQALSGTGVVKLANGTDKLGPGNIVLVAPSAEHEIVPDGKGDLVLLVHFLKAAAAEAGGHPAAGHEAAGHAHHDSCEHEHAADGKQAKPSGHDHH